MAETITFHALDLSGETALKLFLRKNDGTLLNTGGDALIEISSSGVFAATLAEARTGLGSLSVRVCDGTETADNLLFDGFLPEGSTTIGATAELDPATQTKIDNILEDTGTTLPVQISGISGGSGTGARTVTVTVNDGTTVLQNAVVRFTEGANTFRALTNASGVATFNLDDATYTVAVTKSGYSFAGTSMVVNGTETATYSMTAISTTPPSNPALSAIEVLCLDEDFEAAAGIDVDFRIAAVASGDQNRAHPGAKKTITSNGSGIARFEGPQGSTIEYRRGTGQVWTSVVLDNDSVTNVTSVIGSP